MGKVKGIEDTLTRLRTEIDQIKGVTLAGLMAGGLIVQAEAQRRVPVEYGTLRASAYTRRAMSYPMAVEVGFSAAYAVFVHENMEASWRGRPRRSGIGVYWGPRGEPRFLANALDAKRSDVLNAISSRASRQTGAA